MEAAQSYESIPAPAAFRNLDQLFESVRKATVIKLRWPLVILCSYLLLCSPSSGWLTPLQTDFLLFFYLFTNATLYFIPDHRFESPYFYGPLLLFDTLLLVLVLGLSGGTTTDFYLACFVTLMLSCISNDPRSLLVVTITAPLIYGYVVFNSTAADNPAIYLRLPFPLVIAAFYGYFAQVERLRKVAREHEEQARQQRSAAEEIRRQRDRLETLHDIDSALAAAIISQNILDVFLEKALMRLPYAAALVRLQSRQSGVWETAACRGIAAGTLEDAGGALAFVDRIAENRAPLAVQNISSSTGLEGLRFFLERGFVSCIGLPLVAHDDVKGSMVFFAREEEGFSPEEIEFLSTLAGQAAMAIHYSRLFERIQDQANELRRANRVKDEFVGVVSHELKTPLNVISGYANMLIEGMLGQIDPVQERALRTILRQAKELNGLINSVLQVSSIEAEMLRIELHEVNFWEFLYELKSCYDYPLEKDIKLNWEFSSDMPMLAVDRGKLKHIFENLINNAIKFTEQGSVTISARYLATQKMVEFKVADTGVGIPNEMLPTIFERFHQVDSSDTRLHGGVGLGLYIVKRYLEVLGGTIQVLTQVGKGSSFTVQIPCGTCKKQPPRHNKLSCPPDTGAYLGDRV